MNWINRNRPALARLLYPLISISVIPFSISCRQRSISKQAPALISSPNIKQATAPAKPAPPPADPYIRTKKDIEDKELVDAIEHQNRKRVLALLKAGVSPNARARYDYYDDTTALIRAVLNNDEPMNRLLLQKGANVNEATEMGNTPLIVAAAQGNLSIMKLLIKYHADVNAINGHGVDAASIAITSERSDVFKVLKQAGAIQAKYVDVPQSK